MKKTVQVRLGLAGIALAAALALLLPARCTPLSPFFWGAGTAAYQVEGGVTNADWTLFEQMPGKIENGDRAGQAADHWNRFETDFQLAASQNHNAHRLSIEWSRIEPQRDVYDPQAVAHYHAVLASLRAKNIFPIVTINHFTLPAWVLNPLDPGSSLGGWENSATIDEFVELVTFLAQEYGAEVDWWIPLNEPMVVCTNGYLFGAFPPARQFDIPATKAVRVNLLTAHARAYDAIHANDTVDADSDWVAANVGIAHSFFQYEPLNAGSSKDVAAAQKWKYFYEWSFLQTLTDGMLDVNLDGDTTDPGTTPAEGYHPELAGRLDWIGVNYYGSFLVAHSDYFAGLIPFLTGIPQPDERPGVAHSDLGWAIDAEGFSSILAGVWSRFHKPIIVTENGMLTTNDYKKTQYILDHVERIGQARNDGVEVRGYLAWCLLDTFEWTSGNRPGFGLIAVNPRNQSRRVTPAARALRDVIAEGGVVTPEIRARYAAPTEFLWGSATSSYEMEGQTTNADWWLWEELPGKIAGGQRSGYGADFYRQYASDIATAATNGQRAFRFALEWSRIEPQRGVFDATAIAHYRSVLTQLRSHGITPVVCLQHYTLPQWILNPKTPNPPPEGWLSQQTVVDFAGYAAYVATQLGDLVDWWQTLNEPEWATMGAYAITAFPPGEFNNTNHVLTALQFMALAHAEAYHLLHQRDTVDADGDGVAARVSIISSVNVWIPKDPENPADVASRDRMERFFNWMVPDLVTTGAFDADLDGTPEQTIPSLAGTEDYMTLTYYTRFRANGNGLISYLGGLWEHPYDDPTVEKMDNGFEVYPEGLYTVLTEAYARYGLPILIGENGMDIVDETHRASGMIRTIAQMQKASYQGVNIRGYLYWGLLDAFSWGSGRTPGVGLIHVNFDTLARTVSPGMGVYQQVIANEGTTYDLEKTYVP